MKTHHGLWGGPAILAIVFAAGCASGGAVAGGAPAGGVDPSGDGMAGDPAPVSASEFEAIFERRIAATRVVLSEADVTFMTRMIGHHEQAIEMSKLAPTHGANPSIQVMAARIINAQADEIALMGDWLRVRNLPLPGEAAGGHQHHDGGAMFGMLTPEQYARLEAARGEEFDRLFLTFMIQHHNGAVTMVEELFATDGAAHDEEVFKFASDTLADQGSEVDRMETMLAAMPAR